MKYIPVLLAVIVLLTGCVQPEIKGIEAHWGNVTEKSAELRAEVDIQNPLPFLPLKDVESLIYVNGIEIGEGHAVKISPEKITLSIRIDNEKIRDFWVSHLNSGERSEVLVKVYPVVNLIITEWRFPVEFGQTLETDFFGMNVEDTVLSVGGKDVLELKDVTLTLSDVSNLKTDVAVSGVIKNRGMIDVRIVKIDYRILVNDVVFGERSKTFNMMLKPGESGELTATIQLDNKKIPEWWVKHLKNGETSEVKFEARIYVNVGGIDSVVQMGHTSTFSTSIAAGLSKSIP